MKTKYPRTLHLPWSLTVAADDKRLPNTSCFNDKAVIVTEKMDGENSSLYRDGFHARSLDSRHHESRSWIKSLHSRIAHEIPNGWRICGENLFAQHSIQYTSLDSYFYVFSVWDDRNVCLSWDDTVEWCNLLGLVTVPVLGRWDRFNERSIQEIVINTTVAEGYVLRNADSFHADEFGSNVAKFVRRNHVQTDQHWTQNWTQNALT